MKNPGKIGSVLILLIGLTFFSCEADEEARPFAEKFFSKVIAKKYGEAAKMIDPQSKLYPKRFEIVRKLKTDKRLGTLQSTGGKGMIEAHASTTIANFSFTTVDFGIKLNYDSTSTMINIQVIDRGKGFRINKIYR